MNRVTRGLSALGLVVLLVSGSAWALQQGGSALTTERARISYVIGMDVGESLVAAGPDEAPLSRDQRLGAQRALAAAGFDPGGIDGIVGSGTRRALRAWQQANGLPPDGHLTAALADRLIAGQGR